MKIAFLGLKRAIDYYQIGGTESFVRRLATEMIKDGIQVDYILYGNEDNKELQPMPGITLRYFTSFKETLPAIDNYDHIITIYLLPKDRLKYAFFRKRSHKTRFHFVYFNWQDSFIKRMLYFNEARLFPYSGRLFCISKRQHEQVKKWAHNAVYLLPPVPDGFFLAPEEKPNNKKIKVTFLGRIDPGKGINEVIEIFKAFRSNDTFEASIYGIYIPENKQSVAIHNWLKNQEDIRYIEVDRQKYSPKVDDFVKDVLKETDIFIQPYQRLSSTIDTPLLLLETMASLCAVITKPFGNIPDIYGESRFIMPEKDFVPQVLNMLKGLSMAEIVKERERIYRQNKKLQFEASQIAERFLGAIHG